MKCKEVYISSLQRFKQQRRYQFNGTILWSNQSIKKEKKDLKNHRGIFLTSILYKTSVKHLLNRNKENISNCMAEFQWGGHKGMSTLDNIMALRGIIERNRTLRRNTYLFFGDARKSFDQLWVWVGFDVYYQRNITGHKLKRLILIYMHINERTNFLFIAYYHMVFNGECMEFMDAECISKRL